MKKIIGSVLIAAGVGMAALGYAQTTVSVDINKAKLTWSYNQADQASINQFIVKCGPSTGNYTKVTSVPDVTARSLAVKTAITGPGTWFCVVTAANADAESGPTNEVGFKAFTPPPAPTGLGVLLQ